MAFVDVLALEMVTLVLTAALLAFGAVAGLMAYRRRGAEGLRTSLRGAVGPSGVLGTVVLALGLWGQIAWPLPGAYNILFSDVYLLLGIVLVGFAVTVLMGARLQYVGVLAAVSGAVVFEYGYQGYLLGLTKEPFEMFGLYGAFALAGLLALPATLVADRMMSTVRWGTSVAAPRASPRRLGTWARLGGEPSPASAAESESTELPYLMPRYATLLVLGFVAIMVVAGVAALFFVGNTVPSHLAHPP